MVLDRFRLSAAIRYKQTRAIRMSGIVGSGRSAKIGLNDRQLALAFVRQMP